MEVRNSKTLFGKKALITGGTKGLGLATAQLFARNGADIFVTYRSDQDSAKQALESIEKLGVKCEAIQCDLSEEGSANRLFDQITSRTSAIDIYIHNAAATSFKNLTDLEAHHIDKTMNITVKALILGIKRLVPLMPSGGAIVTVSGMDTERAVPRHGLLGAAKAALETLTAYYAHELAPKKIRVNCVNPGFFGTESTQKYLGPMFDHVQNQFIQTTPLKRAATLDDIANVISFLSSDEAKWIVGQTIHADGGFNFAMSF